MNYFIGSLYGNYHNYCIIKEQLQLKPQDTLWILGDILDGNDENPEDCINILRDIMDSPNINLVLGDHEYAHIMRYISIHDKEKHDGWKEFLEHMDISGNTLLYYIENVLDEYEKDDIFGFLINECEITNFIQIGDYYFYLVHGFPTIFQGNLSEWQLLSTTNMIDNTDFLLRIKTDPSIPRELIKNLNKNNCFVICSHQYNDDFSGIHFENSVFLLGENRPDEYITVLGADAAGYFKKKIVY